MENRKQERSKQAKKERDEQVIFDTPPLVSEGMNEEREGKEGSKKEVNKQQRKKKMSS